MKVSRKFMGSAVLALSTMLAWGASVRPASAAYAAQGRGKMSAADRAKMMTNRVDRAVQLTDEQKPKVEAIYEKAASEAAAARQQGGPEARTTIRKINQQAAADVRALLTPEQLTKFPAPGGRRRGGPPAQ